ncbi:MAG: sensor domain-containing diguanylate cyclase [Sulfuricurvum sp.]|uniref:sensor domain-containing diguanylate cyclase n=2 Tax=Sulfuricurvum sp. TaxID=2025608 RepID=UPI00271AEA61|nr:sensor domain-containing diguanylate cyclase [Sulfuricurvum sp.]MDO9055389.1 sensor domain-containing diguanylate cyclase [Sulfuricurvum sp.]
MSFKTIFVKLIIIVAAIEFILMTSFHFLLLLPPFLELVVDVFLLALLSTPFIYHFVLRPIEAVFIRQKKLEESMLHLSNQFIDNIDHEFDKKLESVLKVASDAFNDISVGAIYELNDTTYRQYHRYIKNDKYPLLLPNTIDQEDTAYLNDKLQHKQSLFFCQNEDSDQHLIKIFNVKNGCILILPMFSREILEGFICFQTFSTQEFHHDELLILMFAAQMIINAMKRHAVDQQLKKYSNALMQTGDAVCITDKSGIIEYVNPAFEELSKYKQNELIGQKTSIMRSGFHDNTFYDGLWNTIESGKQFHGDFVNKNKSGILYHEEKTISSIKNDEGEVTNYLSTGRDITQRKAMENALRELATKDKLTNVFNRNQCDLFYENLIERIDKEHNLYLLLFDIDNFKHINDTFGHHQGDSVLKKIASLVQEAIRPEDILIRWGGEEFIIMSISENDHSIQMFAERIRITVASSTYDEIPQVTISIGLSKHDTGMSKEMLFEQADQAMYHAKKEGKNRVYHFRDTQTI